MIKYDSNNIFAKIIRKELPSKIFYEDDDVIVIYDINPVKKIHLLFIPKKPVINYDDFIENSTEIEISNFFKIINKVIKNLDIKNNYKLQANSGSVCGQEVMHFHMHLMSPGVV
jgi:histidine triad (HIT) family protein